MGKYQTQLNKLLTKASTLKLINELSVGFNTQILSISDQTLADISKKSSNNKKKSIKSNNSEDSDDESDEIFSFEAYMKLKKQNRDKSDNEELDDIGNEADDVYPVDQDANYQIISKHFEAATTMNDNIDHSVLNFDDLKSIHLREDSSESDSSDTNDYADSKVSINTKESATNKHKWSVDETEENGKSVISDDKSSVSTNHLIAINTNTNSMRKHRWSVDEDDDDDDKEKEDEFYDETDSAMGIKSPVLSDNNSKPKTFTNALKKRASKSVKSLKLKKKSSKNNVAKVKKKKIKKEIKSENSGLNEVSLGLMSTMEQKWNNLCDRALNDYDWNERDCQMLLDEASILNKREIVVYSQWLLECNNVCKQNKNTMKSIKCAVIIGYPAGQQCLASKVSEIKWCIKHKVDKVIVVLSAGKIIDRHWNYVKKEVAALYKVTGKKCKLEIRHAKSQKIDNSTKAMFQQTVDKILQ